MLEWHCTSGCFGGKGASLWAPEEGTVVGAVCSSGQVLSLSRSSPSFSWPSLWPSWIPSAVVTAGVGERLDNFRQQTQLNFPLEIWSEVSGPLAHERIRMLPVWAVTAPFPLLVLLGRRLAGKP